MTKNYEPRIFFIIYKIQLTEQIFDKIKVISQPVYFQHICASYIINKLHLLSSRINIMVLITFIVIKT